MPKDEVGSWASDKLERLRRYLHEYTKIMRKQHWCQGYYYIDAFAGPGSHAIRSRPKPQPATQRALIEVSRYAQLESEHQEFIAGSPRVALELQYPFTAYVFVEKNPQRVDQLERLKQRFSGTRAIRIRKADCNRYLLKRVVSTTQVDWKTHRALVFLDPFGMQVPWDTLEALGSTRAIEVFLNFPVGMAIQRLLPRDPGKLTRKRRAMLDSYFGSPDWSDLLYRRERGLFGDEEQKIERSAKVLLKWYRERLREAFGHVSKAALIRNTRGAHLYYLLLASPNSTGVRIADHILGAGETIRLR